MHRLAIFASGSGTNAENIIRYFQNKPQIKVSCICTNRADAYVAERVRPYHIPVLVFSRQDFYETEKVLDYLEENKIDWIILAGFLWLIPANLIDRYASRIINIHPALLPKYGGKGMYGSTVHKAVIENHEKQSGITIHFVNKEYDKGNIIFQVACDIDPADTSDTLASRVHALEYAHFPRVIEEVVTRDEGRGMSSKHRRREMRDEK
jgi:phosphoribosylglycinamide formyltransferase 1